MGAMASQISGVSIVCSTVGSGADKKKTKLRVTGLNSPVNPPHKGPVTQKIFDDVIMIPPISLGSDPSSVP